MPFSAVIFDLDGVIADTESVQLRAFNAVLNPFGIEISEYQWATQYVGIPVEKDLATIHSQFQLPIALESLAVKRRETYAQLLQGPNGLQPTPGLVTLLNYLESNTVATAIASGSPRADVMNVLRLLGIANYFRVVVTSDDVSRSKPSPDVYLRAASELAMPPASCVAVEDSATGMVAAKTAGMTVIGFQSKFTQYQDLRPDLSISNLSDIQAIISKARAE